MDWGKGVLPFHAIVLDTIVGFPFPCRQHLTSPGLWLMWCHFLPLLLDRVGEELEQQGNGRSKLSVPYYSMLPGIRLLFVEPHHSIAPFPCGLQWLVLNF